MTFTRRSTAAFTLVELLVATAITAVIVVMLGTMFGSLSSTSLRANQRIDSFRDARAALQMIQRDLSGLVRTQWDVKTTPVPPPPPTPITRPAAYLALKNLYVDPSGDNQQIYALVAAKNSGPGDVCSVGYYCRWDSTRKSYSLHRYFRGSAETYDIIRDSIDYASDEILYKPDPSDTDPALMKDEVLASYVWNLRITPYDASGVALTPAYPYVCDSSADTNNPAPAVLEISFKAMSQNAARALISSGAGADVWMTPANAAYQRLIAPNVYEFRTRIQL